MTRHGKTYTNDHPLNVRKLTDSKRIANGFEVVPTLCTNVLTLSPDLLTVCVNALTDCSNALTVCSNALTICSNALTVCSNAPTVSVIKRSNAGFVQKF